MRSVLAVLACPDCPPVREARALVLADAFWRNAMFALLPFILTVLAIWWIARSIDARSRK